MKLRIFAIRDAKVDAYLQPFYAQTTAAGLRIWKDAVTSEGSGFARNPEDYMLFELGEFDQQSGKLTSLLQPHPLTTAMEELPKPVNPAWNNGTLGPVGQAQHQ